MTHLDHPLLIVGFGPRARIGKDFAAQKLRDAAAVQGIPAFKLAFADPLKADLDALLADKMGISAFAESDADKAKIRPILVAYGNAMRDAVGENYWVDKAFDGPVMCYANRLSDQVPVLITVTDVRYKNEVEALKKLGGIYLHINANDVPYANDVEAQHAPGLRHFADVELWNNFDDDFEVDVLSGVRDAMVKRGLDFPRLS